MRPLMNPLRIGHNLLLLASAVLLVSAGSLHATEIVEHIEEPGLLEELATDAEAAAAVQRILKRLKDEYGIERRG